MEKLKQMTSWTFTWGTPQIEERTSIWEAGMAGRRCGENAQSSRQSGPGSIPTQRHMWVEFVVGSRLAPMVFSCSSDLLPSTKLTSLNSSSIRLEEPHENSWGWCDFLSEYSHLFYYNISFTLAYVQPILLLTGGLEENWSRLLDCFSNWVLWGG